MPIIEIEHYLPLNEEFKNAHKLLGDELFKAKVNTRQLTKQAYRENKDRCDKKNTKVVQKSLDAQSNAERRLTAIEKYYSQRDVRSINAIEARKERNNAPKEIEVNGHIVYQSETKFNNRLRKRKNRK